MRSLPVGSFRPRGQRRDPPARRRPGRADRSQRQRDDRPGACPVGLRHRARRLLDAGPRSPWARHGRASRALWNDAVRLVARGRAAACRARDAERGRRPPSSRSTSPAAAPMAATSITASSNAWPDACAIVLDERAPSLYTTTVAALPAGSYGLMARPARRARGARTRPRRRARTRRSTSRLRSGARRSASSLRRPAARSSLPGIPHSALGRPPLAPRAACSCSPCCSTWSRSRLGCCPPDTLTRSRPSADVDPRHHRPATAHPTVSADVVACASSASSGSASLRACT